MYIYIVANTDKMIIEKIVDLLYIVCFLLFQDAGYKQDTNIQYIHLSLNTAGST